MKEKLKICSSTKRPISNDPGAVTFLCPKCGKHEIVRSTSARAIAAPYECPLCGFKGPN